MLPSTEPSFNVGLTLKQEDLLASDLFCRKVANFSLNGSYSGRVRSFNRKDCKARTFFGELNSFNRMSIKDSKVIS